MGGFHILTPGGTGCLCLPADSNCPASAARRSCRRRDVFGKYPRQVRSASLLSCLQAVLVHGGDMAVLRRHRLADVVLTVFLVSRRAQVLVRSGLVPVGGPAGWRGARQRSG